MGVKLRHSLLIFHAGLLRRPSWFYGSVRHLTVSIIPDQVCGSPPVLFYGQVAELFLGLSVVVSEVIGRRTQIVEDARLLLKAILLMAILLVILRPDLPLVKIWASGATTRLLVPHLNLIL